MIKAVIFDLDEVLIESKKQAIEFRKILFKHFKLKIPPKKYDRYFYTISLEGIYEKFFSKKVKKKEFYDFYDEIVKPSEFKKMLKFVKISKNAEKILKYLKKNKIRLAIVSNRGITTPLILRHFRIKKYFTKVMTALNVKKHKPHPYPINKVIRELGIKKSEAIYVGDAKVDIEAGTRAKLKVVL